METPTGHGSQGGAAAPAGSERADDAGPEAPFEPSVGGSPAGQEEPPRTARGWFFLWGVAAPWLTVLIGISGGLQPFSRRDEFHELALMLLGGPPFLVMLPLIVIGLSAVLRDFARVAVVLHEGGRRYRFVLPGPAAPADQGARIGAITRPSPWFRAALGIGVACGVWFQLVVFASEGWWGFAALGASLAVFALPFVEEHLGDRGAVPIRALALGSLGVTGIAAMVRGEEIQMLLLWPVYAAFAGSPAMLALCCATVLRRIGREHGRALRGGGFGPSVTAATAFPLWVLLSVHRGLADYAALSPSEGDCFVATAASRGHSELVGERSGSLTRQLATFKAGELALRAMRPAWHRALRRVYDRHGPAAARGLTGPWRADLAHVLLAPAAALVRLVLAVALPGWDEGSRGR